jgi:predicted metal-binding protein
MLEGQDDGEGQATATATLNGNCKRCGNCNGNCRGMGIVTAVAKRFFSGLEFAGDAMMD